MTDSYVQTPEARINDLCRDLYVAAAVAKQGKLNVKTADGVSARLRAAASDMISDDDRELLKAAAERLETLTLRVKAGGRPRVKAVARTPAPAPQPDWGALAHAEDLERMASAGPFSVNGHEESERRRAEEGNRLLRERNRRHEAQRAAQVEAARRPKGPGR